MTVVVRGQGCDKLCSAFERCRRYSYSEQDSTCSLYSDSVSDPAASADVEQRKLSGTLPYAEVLLQGRCPNPDALLGVFGVAGDAEDRLYDDRLYRRHWQCAVLCQELALCGMYSHVGRDCLLYSINFWLTEEGCTTQPGRRTFVSYERFSAAAMVEYTDVSSHGLCFVPDASAVRSIPNPGSVHECEATCSAISASAERLRTDGCAGFFIHEGGACTLVASYSRLTTECGSSPSMLGFVRADFTALPDSRTLTSSSESLEQPCGSKEEGAALCEAWLGCSVFEFDGTTCTLHADPKFEPAPPDGRRGLEEYLRQKARLEVEERLDDAARALDATRDDCSFSCCSCHKGRILDLKNYQCCACVAAKAICMHGIDAAERTLDAARRAVGEARHRLEDATLTEVYEYFSPLPMTKLDKQYCVAASSVMQGLEGMALEACKAVCSSLQNCRAMEHCAGSGCQGECLLFSSSDFYVCQGAASERDLYIEYAALLPEQEPETRFVGLEDTGFNESLPNTTRGINRTACGQACEQEPITQCAGYLHRGANECVLLSPDDTKRPMQSSQGTVVALRYKSNPYVLLMNGSLTEQMTDLGPFWGKTWIECRAICQAAAFCQHFTLAPDLGVCTLFRDQPGEIAQDRPDPTVDVYWNSQSYINQPSAFGVPERIFASVAGLSYGECASACASTSECGAFAHDWGVKRPSSYGIALGEPTRLAYMQVPSVDAGLDLRFLTANLSNISLTAGEPLQDYRASELTLEDHDGQQFSVRFTYLDVCLSTTDIGDGGLVLAQCNAAEDARQRYRKKTAHAVVEMAYEDFKMQSVHHETCVTIQPAGVRLQDCNGTGVGSWGLASRPILLMAPAVSHTPMCVAPLLVPDSSSQPWAVRYVVSTASSNSCEAEGLRTIDDVDKCTEAALELGLREPGFTASEYNHGNHKFGCSLYTEASS